MSRETHVITIYNSKGGVAKTTLTGLLAQHLAGSGYRVVIIDYDRQGSQTELFDLPLEEHLHDVLRRNISILDVLTPVPGSMIPPLCESTGTLHVAQGGPQTKLAIDAVTMTPIDFDMMSCNEVLMQPLIELSECGTEFILIDMGPSDQRQAISALVVTDWLLIPTTMDYMSVRRIDGAVLREVARTQRVNSDLKILGIIPVMTKQYFGGLRRSKNTQAGEAYLHTNFANMLFADDEGLIDLPDREDWRNVMWTGEPLLASKDVSKVCLTEAQRFLGAVSKRLGVGHV